MGQEHHFARFNQFGLAPERGNRTLLQIFQRALALLDSLQLGRRALSPSRARLEANRLSFAARLRQGKLDNVRLATLEPKCHRGNRHRQLETPRTGTAWIDEENTTPSFHGGLVRVAGDHNGEAGRGWIKVQFREIVKHVDRMRPKLDDFSSWKACGPCTPVVVAANRAHRRDSRE
jgi:hypothetical protein